MMCKIYRMICPFILFIYLIGCESSLERPLLLSSEKKGEIEKKVYIDRHNSDYPIDLSSYEQMIPLEWGERVTGVKTTFETSQKEIALTFDACGGPSGNDVDEELINFLIEEQIPATLFLNKRWIDANQATFYSLAEQPFFQIENHGTNHLPLSVNGGEAWDIPATTSVQEVYEEIMTNHDTVQKATGRKMTLFRSGTAYYDEVSVKIAEALGYQVVNFDILGDAGATYTSEQVKEALLQAQKGSIVLLHMNQPKSGTAQGVIEAIPLLQQKGFHFVTLENRKLK